MLLTVCSVLPARLVLGQSTSVPASSGGTGSNGSGNTGSGEAGYAISGEAAPPSTAQVYRYERSMPETKQEVYWVVTNAATINDVAAESWPEGSLNALTYPQLHIKWRDSVVIGRVALRYQDVDTGENREAFGLPVVLPASMPLSGGQKDFAIIGETEVKAGTVYTYEGQLPETDQQWYWVVEGAKTINGVPADSVAPRSLLAADYKSIMVEWQDSTALGRLALQHQEFETGEVQEGFFVVILIGVVIGGGYLSCQPNIQYNIGAGWNGLPTGNYVSTGLCLRVLSNGGNRIRINLPVNANCREGYSWRYEYQTENGHSYGEIWSSTSNEFYGPRFYDFVPTNPRVSGAPNELLSYGSSPSGYMSLSAYTNSANPYAGERITLVKVFANGRRCGVSGMCGDISIATTYMLRGLLRPQVQGVREMLANNTLGPLLPPGQALCIGKRYQLFAEEDRRTTGSIALFEWGTNIGTAGIAGTYPNYYYVLDLRQVTAATAPSQVDLSVFGRNPGQATSANCYTNSNAATATYYIQTTPQPQNLRLGGSPQICAFPAQRTLLVNAVPNATEYTWRVLSGNAQFDQAGSVNKDSQLPTIPLIFIGPGAVQVSVTAHTACDRESAPATAVFGADPNAVPAPLPADLLAGYAAYDWHPNTPALIPILNPHPGITYTLPQLLDVERFNQNFYYVYTPTSPKTSAVAAGLNPSDYVTLGSSSTNTSFTITILSNRVASATVRVLAYNTCNPGQSVYRDYMLVRPLNDDQYGGFYFRPGATADDTAATPGRARPAKESADRQLNAPPQLYPNPVSDQLRIVAATPETRYERVTVLNVLGKVMQEAQAAAGVTELSLKTLPAGVYIVRLFDGQQYLTQRIVKQ